MSEAPSTSSSLLVVTHGRLAEHLVQAALHLEGEAAPMEAVCLDWNDDVAESSRKIEEAVTRLRDHWGSVLVLTDMFGGGATDVALSLHEPGAVEVATGVNLPMILKFVQLRGQCDFSQVVRKVADQGRASIQVAGDLLRKPSGDPTPGPDGP